MTRQAPSRPPAAGEEAPQPPNTAAGVLAAGIDRVTARLDSRNGQPERHDRLATELRVALARVAACGATCYLRAATDHVRTAAVLLDAGAPFEARALLGDARTALDVTQP
jgi:hypothetical protein